MALSPDGGTALAVGEGGTILRSGDRGATWAAVAAGTNAWLQSVALSPDGGTALAVGQGGTILRSGDRGATWADPIASYHRSVPPLSWVIWTLGLMLLVPGFLSLEPPRPAPLEPAGILASDRPLRRGDPDAAGTDHLAGQLTRFLGNPRTMTPVTIAITGEWGSGKSSVLSRLHDALRDTGQRPVWFNAWHHQGEDNLFAALLQAVRVQAVPYWCSAAGLEVRLRLLRARIVAHPARWLLSLLVLGGVCGFLWERGAPDVAEIVRQMRTSLGDGSKLAERVPQFLLAAGVPVALLGLLLLLLAETRSRLTKAGLDPGRLLAGAARAVGWKDLGAQLGFRTRFQEALKELTAALGHRRLTLIVDDLDRCRPAQIAEVLEAVNFLTDGDGCFVVLGLARRQVLAGLGLAYKDMAAELSKGENTAETRAAYAENFLRKMIQIEIAVRPFDAAAARKLVNTAVEAPPSRDKLALPRALIVPCVLAWLAAGAWMGTEVSPWAEKLWRDTAPVKAPVVVVEPGPPPKPPPPRPRTR